MRIFCPAMARWALFLVDPLLLGAGTLATRSGPPTPEVGGVAPFGTMHPGRSRAGRPAAPSRDGRRSGIRRVGGQPAPCCSRKAARQGSAPTEQPEQFARRGPALTNPVGPGAPRRPRLPRPCVLVVIEIR